MTDPISLVKANPLLPAEDYVALRRRGFTAIERLGSALWTDYNNSDPGITIEEAVCYAITDLAYRTGFEIKDLLAPKELTGDTWRQIFYTARQILHNSPLTIDDYRKLIIDVDGVRNAWIQPSKDYEVPIWIDYFQWDLMENGECNCEDAPAHVCRGSLQLTPVASPPRGTPAERTAAVRWAKSKLKAQGDALQESLKERRLKLEALLAHTGAQSEAYGRIKRQLAAVVARQTALDKLFTDTDKEIVDDKIKPLKIVEFEGLYNVLVEYEEDILEEEKREEVRQRIVARLSRHRNLCEDFLNIDSIDYVDVGIGASIELEEYADPDTVLAQIFFTIYKYFTPSIPFRTIDQLIAKGYLVDEIFEGPALAHGFVESSDLVETALFRDIRLSDVINEVADIKGVKGILYLHLPFDPSSAAGWDKSQFDLWIDELRQSRELARVVPSKSQILFCKERDVITYYTGGTHDRRPERMLKLFRDLKALERKYKLSGHATDFPVPLGEYMQLEDYYPVTYSLPMCYGVSERAGLPGDADATRQAQALQLKGYLLFFEQLLAGYLAQLNHVRDLFTFDSSVEHTYFGKVLDEIEGLKALVIDHEGHGDWTKIRERFEATVQILLERPALFGIRRNHFLDHMLARFSEDLTEYERISRWLTPNQVDARLIADKARILRDGHYRGISSDRGRAYDYRQSKVWDTENVSGAERRVGRLLGFADVTRRTLVPSYLVSKPVMITDPVTKLPAQKKNAKGQALNVVLLLDPEDESRVLLTSVDVADGCCTDDLMMAITDRAVDPHNFRSSEARRQNTRQRGQPAKSFIFELFDGPDFENATLLAASDSFETAEARTEAMRRLRTSVETIHGNEGFHLVEHLLLRPKFDEVLDEAGNPIDVSLLSVCLDQCDLGIGLGEGTEVPPYRKRIERVPARICYDKMPWMLKYLAADAVDAKSSLLFQEVPIGAGETIPLKFRTYAGLRKRVRDLEEFGSERANYRVKAKEGVAGKMSYGFVVLGARGVVLAQSLYVYDKNDPVGDLYDPKNPDKNVEIAIRVWMRYFGYEFDLYCEADPCDNNEDPYSFRATAVVPCWAGRLRDPTFRNLVERTIRSESPAHVHVRIVWVDVREMQRFEQAYYGWLQAMLPNQLPPYESVNPLVDVLNTLRPCGSCEDDCD